MSTADGTVLKLPPSSTDDEQLAFISDTTTTLSTVADQYPLIVHLLSMVREEANKIRLDRGLSSAPGQSGS